MILLQCLNPFKVNEIMRANLKVISADKERPVANDVQQQHRDVSADQVVGWLPLQTHEHNTALAAQRKTGVREDVLCKTST